MKLAKSTNAPKYGTSHSYHSVWVKQNFHKFDLKKWNKYFAEIPRNTLTLSNGVVFNKVSSYLINFPSNPPAYIQESCLLFKALHLSAFLTLPKLIMSNFLFLCLKLFWNVFAFKQYNLLC